MVPRQLLAAAAAGAALAAARSLRLPRLATAAAAAAAAGAVFIRPFALARSRNAVRPPKAILVLGGEWDRMRHAADFASGRLVPGCFVAAPALRRGRPRIPVPMENEKWMHLHSNLPVYVSTGPDGVGQLMLERGVPANRLHIDNRAVDTVTNMTNLVDDFRRKGLVHVYVLTSDYHMRRASVIASIVLGSRGIAYTTVSVPSRQSTTSTPPIPSAQLGEASLRVARDALRALAWVAMGWDGAWLVRFVHPDRFPQRVKGDRTVSAG